MSKVIYILGYGATEEIKEKFNMFEYIKSDDVVLMRRLFLEDMCVAAFYKTNDDETYALSNPNTLENTVFKTKEEFEAILGEHGKAHFLEASEKLSDVWFNDYSGTLNIVEIRDLINNVHFGGFTFEFDDVKLDDLPEIDCEAKIDHDVWMYYINKHYKTTGDGPVYN